jgi:hypothetical protein|tara:strand:+ start:253 stop:387 length:135 start_codon:yes stop_codon:yes gene_type:complete
MKRRAKETRWENPTFMEPRKTLKNITMRGRRNSPTDEEVKGLTA